MPAVCTDDHPGVLGDGALAGAMPADAGRPGRPTMTISETVNPSRTSAPASAAASTSTLSSTVRRGQYATGSSAVPGEPEIVNGPKSNAYVSIGGHPVAVTRSSSPHRRSAAMPGGWIRCVEIVSLGNVARSTTSTR